ncbi:MAG: bifunctional UDP-N-acetylglucosamine diphosphorylase/glucosamine-1-phosphate N-acetyltransferase GlmU [Halanaerobiales bacterium]|nr:bifunctional UDP-N-acetylglucosamine diphosphorylase/glucosamine-1-phosphate N-acetyltransferase GlmU [Halanaerobiales bacterium]
MTDLLTIILAAGQGTRMKSNLIKVLHQLNGQPMIQHIVDQVKGLSSKVIVVVGYQAEKVRASLSDQQLVFVEQKEQLGTGHAVMQAQEYIKKHSGPVLILCGDTPLLTAESLKVLVDTKKRQEAAATILTAYFDNPAGYGKIIRNQAEQVIGIVEEKDASPAEQQIKEINSGVYCIDSLTLNQALEQLGNSNAQGEYYLTDAISYLNERRQKIIPVVINDGEEIIGVNDRINLARAEKVLRERINNDHMRNGVTIIDPATTYIDSRVEIGFDTVIYPFTTIEGDTKIGQGNKIGSYCRIKDAIIGNNVEIIDHCILLNCSLADQTMIGPFAYIRPGTTVAQGAKVGDFVELKKAFIGCNSKVPHLSYVGDAVIGEGTNIGAGTIFANYDGKVKHNTIVGSSVFIGSNSTLVAPVKIADGGKTGAGAVVTKDVPQGETVVGVPARVIKEKKEGGSKDH